MPTLPELFAQTVADHRRPGRTALADIRRGSGCRRVRRVDLARLRRTGRPGRGRAARARCRPPRPGRAHDAEPAGVPHRRHRGRCSLGATPISIYNSSAPEQVAVPRRALRGVGRDRRGHRFPRALPQGAQRAPRRCVTSRSSTIPSTSRRRTSTGGTRCSARRRSTIDAELGNARARRSRDRDLHVGHHRAAQGRDARPREHGLDDAVLPRGARHGRRPASASCRTCRWRTSRSGRSSHYMATRRPRSRSRRAPTPARSSSYLAADPARSSSSRCRASGRRRTRRCAPRSVPIPRRPRSSTQALEIGWQMSEANARDEAVPDALRRSAGRSSVPALQDVRAPDRARPVRDRDDRCRADPVRDPAVLPQPRCAAVGGVRPLGDERPDDLDAVPRQGRHGRPAVARVSRCVLDDGRRGADARRQRVPRLPRTRPNRPRTCSTPTAGSTPATSACSTTTATSRSSTARRS